MALDRDAAARYGVDPPRDHDQPPKYAPVDYPAGERLSMDPGRFDAVGCWPVFTAQRVIGSNVERWRVTCRNCRGSWRGWTEAEAMQKARVAHGDA